MVLPASCPHSVVVTMGNCRHKVTALDIPLGWCVVHKGEKNYAHQSFVTTPQPGKCAVSTGSNQGPAAVPRLCGPWLRMTCVLDDAERYQIM